MTQVLLVHLAKTGGTTVRRALKALAANNFDCVHHTASCAFATANGWSPVRSTLRSWGLTLWPF